MLHDHTAAVDEPRLQEIERDVKLWQEHYDFPEAEDIETSFPDVITELIAAVRYYRDEIHAVARRAGRMR